MTSTSEHLDYLRSPRGRIALIEQKLVYTVFSKGPMVTNAMKEEAWARLRGLRQPWRRAWLVHLLGLLDRESTSRREIYFAWAQMLLGAP